MDAKNAKKLTRNILGIKLSIPSLRPALDGWCLVCTGRASRTQGLIMRVAYASVRAWVVNLRISGSDRSQTRRSLSA